MARSKEPWQRGPTELIEQALHHLHQQTDVDRRIAFLLLDVGVETLFKTYILLPVKVTGTKLSYSERKKAADGSFHDLVDGIDRAAGPSLAGINLARVQYYHDIRNKLYHDGNGITISANDVDSYAQLAVKLLKVLLSSDLSQVLRKPEIDARRKAATDKVQHILQREISDQSTKVQAARERLANLARFGIEKIEPGLVMPSFEHGFAMLSKQRPSEETQAEQFKKLLLSVAPNSSIADQVSPWGVIFSELTGLHLSVLQVAIEGSESGETWNTWYILSKDYPQSEQQIREYPYEDPESPTGYSVDIYEPTHGDVMDKGKEWQKHLEDACTAIEKWLNAQSSAI